MIKSDQVSETTASLDEQTDFDSLGLIAWNAGKILFRWSGDKPITGPSFALVRDSILEALGDEDHLKIIGQYYRDEDNSSVFPNLGYARANQIKLLFRDLPSNRFELDYAVLRGDTAGQAPHPFSASVLRRVVKNASIREIGGKVIINFPYASDELIIEPEVEAYLDDLVAQLKHTSERVLVVGHTDNSASMRRNLSLGWMRANAIRSLLLRKGLPANRIITESKGEAYPIASNATEEGRIKNRRVEVTIIKDQNL